jgi:site-specific recombinase XerD
LRSIIRFELNCCAAGKALNLRLATSFARTLHHLNAQFFDQRKRSVNPISERSNNPMNNPNEPEFSMSLDSNAGRSLSLQVLGAVPEEEIWLAGQISPQTRQAYKKDVSHFIRTMSIRSHADLHQVTRAAVIAWQNHMRERGIKPRTIRRRLSALSSLFSHLVAQRVIDTNPVREIKRPRVNRRQGTTKAFSAKEARKILDEPDATTLLGLRDRAILSVGLQVGPRRAEIARLLVKDFHTNAGYKSLHFIRKGGEDLSLSINPQTTQRIEDYLAAAGHGGDLEGPLFRPLRKNQLRTEPRRHLHPAAVDRILRKYARAIGIGHGYSAHSMRATFITTALSNGASLEDVQRDVGHADPSTTKLYDRRGHNPEKSAAFFATY